MLRSSDTTTLPSIQSIHDNININVPDNIWEVYDQYDPKRKHYAIKILDSDAYDKNISESASDLVRNSSPQMPFINSFIICKSVEHVGDMFYIQLIHLLYESIDIIWIYFL